MYIAGIIGIYYISAFHVGEARVHTYPFVCIPISFKGKKTNYVNEKYVSSFKIVPV
jgi:hypothetical protein